MDIITETSLIGLYGSAVAAFPRTRMRQHAVDPIILEEMQWTPFVGMRTLFIKASARNEDRHYSPIILFKNVNYEEKDVMITASDGKPYAFAKLSLESTNAVVRCDCKDFRYRFAYYNHNDKSLFGRKPAKYESHGGPPANPSQMPGMCKHLMALSKALNHAGIFYD